MWHLGRKGTHVCTHACAHTGSGRLLRVTVLRATGNHTFGDLLDALRRAEGKHCAHILCSSLISLAGLWYHEGRAFGFTGELQASAVVLVHGRCLIMIRAFLFVLFPMPGVEPGPGACWAKALTSERLDSDS